MSRKWRIPGSVLIDAHLTVEADSFVEALMKARKGDGELYVTGEIVSDAFAPDEILYEESCDIDSIRSGTE